MTRVLHRISAYLPALLAAAIPVVFLPDAGDSFILPRASLVIGGACLGVAVVLVTARSLALGAVGWPLAAAALASVLAFAFSISIPLSLAGSYTRYESLPMRLAYLGLFASAAWLLRERTPREWVVRGFVFGTCVACLEGLQQFETHVGFRPDGNLGNANLLAALVAMALPLAVRRAARPDARAAVWAGAIIVLVAGWWVTTSRSGAFGMVAGCLALAVFAIRGRAVIAAAAGSLLVLALAMAATLASPLRVLNNDPPELRLHLWSDGLRMIAARPFAGWGEEGQGLAFGRFLSQDYASLVTFDRVHSGPLDVAAAQGLLGLAALAWVLIVVLGRAWARRADAEVAALAGALVGYTVWVLFNFDWAPATGPFWLLAGVLWAATGPQGEVSSGARGGSSLVRVGAALVLVVAAVVLAVFPVLADVWYLRGRSDLAVQLDPLQAQYHWAIGTLPELQAASDLGETTPDLYVRLGDAYERSGNRNAARGAYQRALEIDPYFTPASQRLAALGP